MLQNLKKICKTYISPRIYFYMHMLVAKKTKKPGILVSG
jgi:hypothetical protein